MANRDSYFGHYYLIGRNEGTIKLLVGNVASVIFFVNDLNSCWTQEAKNEYMSVHDDAIRELQYEADRLGIYLNLVREYREISVGDFCSIANAQAWQYKLPYAINSSSIGEYQAWYSRYYSQDEVPVFFVFNKPDRSFAYAATDHYPQIHEYSVIFRGPDWRFSLRAIKHEMLHQFGAMDYYYPDSVRQSALSHFSGSVMNMGYESDRNIDSLTAFLIGWTSGLDYSARGFLNDTRYITKAQVEAALSQSISTGG